MNVSATSDTRAVPQSTPKQSKSVDIGIACGSIAARFEEQLADLKACYLRIQGLAWNPSLAAAPDVLWRSTPRRLHLAKRCNYAVATPALRIANDSVTRVSPQMIMLTPTKVPIAHAELDGHCMLIISPNSRVMMPSTSTQLDPPTERSRPLLLPPGFDAAINAGRLLFPFPRVFEMSAAGEALLLSTPSEMVRRSSIVAPSNAARRTGREGRS